MKRKETDYFQVINPKPFLRTFSYREVLSSFSLALIFFTVIKMLRYSGVEFSTIAVGFMTLTPLIFNHVLYKIEHRRSNNFIGRNLHDYIFLVFILLISSLYTWYRESSYSPIDVSLIVSFIFMTFLFEGFLALLKRILNLMKWQIL